MLRVPRFVSLALLGAACCTLLAGCAFPGHVQTTVKIGLSAPFEGLYRDLGYEVLNGVRLAVRQRNQAGGVGGQYLVEQVSLNDFNEADEAARQAREMAVDPGILGVLGGWSRQTAAAAGPLYDQLGLAFVAPDMDPDRLAAQAVRMVAQGGQSEVAVVLHSQDAAEVELGQAFASAFVDRGGTVADSLTPEGDDWAGAITGRAGGTPDVVFLAANALTAGSWIVALRDAGFEGSVMGGPALGSSLLVDIAGEASEGVLFVSPFPPAVEDQPTVDAFRELSGGTPPGPAATWAYSAANQLLDAMDSSARKQGPSLRTNVQKTWLARGDGPGEIYTYVIQPDNIYTVYQPH